MRKRTKRAEQHLTKRSTETATVRVSNIEINCVPAPISRAALSIRFNDGFMLGALFDGRPEEVPTPPAVSLSDAFNHCESWKVWMRSDSRFYFPFTYIVELSAGQQDLVAVKDVRVKIFKRTIMGRATHVSCGHGGDGVYDGVDITIDTTKSITTLHEADSGVEQTMPPTSVGLSGGGFTTAHIGVKPQPGFMYEGQLQIRATVNGSDELFTEGTVDTPIRWAGEPTVSSAGFMDWNFASGTLSLYEAESDYYAQVPHN